MPMTAPDQKETEMLHPETMYELAKLRMAEQHRDAERERLIRQAGTRHSGAIDAVRFRDRLSRLLGTIRPAVDDPTGAPA
jgi:hypothetical protein